MIKCLICGDNLIKSKLHLDKVCSKTDHSSIYQEYENIYIVYSDPFKITIEKYFDDIKKLTVYKPKPGWISDDIIFGLEIKNFPENFLEYIKNLLILQ